MISQFKKPSIYKRVNKRLRRKGTYLRYLLRNEHTKFTFDPKYFVSDNFEITKDTINTNLRKLNCGTDRNTFLKSLATLDNDLPSKYIEIANQTIDHNISLLGKPFYLGQNINWHSDYNSGFTWPRVFSLNLEIINNDTSSDIKYCWELNRFYHAVSLGQAYYISGNEKYTNEYTNQVLSWIKDNPPYVGVNWNCAMESAIRAINLLWAHSMFFESNQIEEDFLAPLFNLLAFHAEFIFTNLENKGVLNGNHYIANLVGLLYISKFLPLKSSTKYINFCLSQLKKEMNNQVLPDGTNFESSIPYHRFVTELFIHPPYLFSIFSNATENRNLSDACIPSHIIKLFGQPYFNKLDSMLNYIQMYTKPDGLAPQIGDNDNGRLLILDPIQHINDHRHLMPLAHHLFDNSDYLKVSSKCFTEYLWMNKNADIPKISEKQPALSSRSYTDFGSYIMRNNKDYLIATCKNLGSGGKGTHSHNDNLSFELCINGISIIVDPGTYTYTGNRFLRNYFRSTRNHSTFSIDLVEQNLADEKDVFYLDSKCIPEVLKWKTNLYRDYFHGTLKYHNTDGLECTLHRKIAFLKSKSEFIFKDVAQGNGNHIVEWNFVADKDIDIFIHNGGVIFNNKDISVALNFISKNNLSYDINSTHLSEYYGDIKTTRLLRLSTYAKLPVSLTYKFSRVTN